MSRNSISDQLEKKVLKAVIERFRSAVSGMRCNVHGKSASITVSSKLNSKGTVDVQFRDVCCDAFKRKLEDRIRSAR